MHPELKIQLYTSLTRNLIDLSERFAQLYNAALCGLANI